MQQTYGNAEYLTLDEKGDILSPMSTQKPTKSSTLIPNAEAYLDHNLNVLLIAKHGVGKTVSIIDLCKAKGLKFKYYSCSTLDPFTDLVGVPTPRDLCPTCKTYYKDAPRREGSQRSYCPECDENTIETLQMIRPREVDEAEVIFFDEFNRADPKTQNALFEIMQFGSINGDPLPNLKACWAAINPPDDEANYQVETLDPALLDRFDIYIEMTPKVSTSYMAKHMPQEIAGALTTWWNDHQNAINNGTKDSVSAYISPRRLEKIGLVWCATKNPKSVGAAIPTGIQAEKRKLIDMLRLAQDKIDKANGDVTEYEEEDDLGGAGLGDRPAEQFIYRLGNLKLEQDKIADFLEANPLHFPTHDKVAETLKSGVGGEDLTLKFARLLNAINPSSLEAMVVAFPTAKTAEMRKGFVQLYQQDKVTAKKMKNLYKVLNAGGNITTPDWPTKL